jgi:hypothetical protein
MKAKLTKFNVKSANWSMNIEIDGNIFDDMYVEACTRCIETSIKKLKKEDDFLLNPIMTVKSLARKNSKEKYINTYKILLNAGMPSKAELLRDIFLHTSQVDLSNEPLSASYAK